MIFPRLNFLRSFPRLNLRHNVRFASFFEKKIRDSCIIHDVIDHLPSDMVLVSWLNGSRAQLGNELTPTQVQQKPNEIVWQHESKKTYLLCMLDPDAPSREKPQQREWLHWLVGNIYEGNVHGGKTLAAYIGAGPPKKAGLHRYIFLLYEQRKGHIHFDEKILTNKSPAGRPNFSMRKFTKKYNLGKPVALNYFQAQFDNYVPTLYKQLGVYK